MLHRADRPASVIVFLVTVALSAGTWLAMPASMRVEPGTDYRVEYQATAHALLEGRGLVGRTGLPATHFPPGYILLLAALDRLAAALGLDEAILVHGFAIACAGLASVVLHRLALRFWRPLPALLVTLAWITYLPAIWTTHQLGSETAYLVAWLTALLLLARGLAERTHGARWLFASGMAIGCAALIRSQAIGLGLILAVLVAWALRARSPRTRAVLAAALLAGNFLTVLPWEVWAWKEIGRVIPLSTSGPATLLNGLVFAARGYRDAGDPPPPRLDELMSALMDRKDEYLTPGHGIQVLREELGARPAAALELFAWKAARSWYATDGRSFEGPMMLIQGTYLALFLASVVAALRVGGARRRVALSILVLVGYFWGMTTIVLSIARYMIPAMPLMFLLLPHLLPERWRSGRLQDP